VIPESATMELSIRSFDEGVRARLEFSASSSSSTRR